MGASQLMWFTIIAASPQSYDHHLQASQQVSNKWMEKLPVQLQSGHVLSHLMTLVVKRGLPVLWSFSVLHCASYYCFLFTYLLNSYSCPSQSDSGWLSTLKIHNIKSIPPPHNKHNQTSHLIGSISIWGPQDPQQNHIFRVFQECQSYPQGSGIPLTPTPLHHRQGLCF